MLNIPNTLTIFRIILIPVFLTAVVYRRFDYAFYVFVAAAITDKLDGAIARLTKKSTPLGRFLDPMADKFMLVTSFIVFLIVKLIPVWLAILVISRDIIIVAGWLLLYLTGHAIRVEPSRLGKFAIASQFVLFTVILIELNYGSMGFLRELFIWLTAVFTAASGLQYIQRGLVFANEKKSGS